MVEVDEELKDYLEHIAQLGYTTRFSCQDNGPTFKFRMFYVQFQGKYEATRFLEEVRPEALSLYYVTHNFARDTSIIRAPFWLNNKTPGERLKSEVFRNENLNGVDF